LKDLSNVQYFFFPSPTLASSSCIEIITKNAFNKSQLQQQLEVDDVTLTHLNEKKNYFDSINIVEVPENYGDSFDYSDDE
jgi:hypothetical protein